MKFDKWTKLQPPPRISLSMVPWRSTLCEKQKPYLEDIRYTNEMWSKTFGSQGPVSQKSRNFSGAIIPFTSLQHRGSKLSTFAILITLVDYIKNILKGQPFKTSRLQFDNWLFGPNKFSGLSRNRLQDRKTYVNLVNRQILNIIHPAHNLKIIIIF